ncbi:Imm42 family immunity protein [Dyella marensis]|uniref:Imm42 family immunity protein n=1 Tax=Dyella TaxID=231454 RepID=UPI00047E3F8A|nr:MULTISPECIES: Imm42 family immunity protein [Dyella]
MIVGQRERFAVEIDVAMVIDGWVYGSFIFWIDGMKVGDMSDLSVDLKGCWHWMRDFIENPMDRFEPGLYEMDKRQIYLRLASPILYGGDPTGFAKEMYQQTYERFHVAHIGMSSFDNVALLLVKDKDGREHLVWEDGGEIRDAFLGAGCMEEVLGEAVAALEGIVISAGDKR